MLLNNYAHALYGNASALGKATKYHKRACRNCASAS